MRPDRYCPLSALPYFDLCLNPVSDLVLESGSDPVLGSDLESALESDLDLVSGLDPASESDFGCEGRPDGVIAMDHVYLRYEQESEEFCLMAEDDQLYADHIDENSTVLVTADGKILPL